MQEVGYHLQIEAIKKSGTERDQFARSAFNRYYYAVFLHIRNMLTGFEPQWAQTPHKSYPEILKGSISKSFSREIMRARKMGDTDLERMLNDAKRAAMALASLMEKANATRITADYQPTEFVNFTDAKRFSLQSIDITEAHGWVSSAQVWANTIEKAWAQIHV